MSKKNRKKEGFFRKIHGLNNNKKIAINDGIKPLKNSKNNTKKIAV